MPNKYWLEHARWDSFKTIEDVGKIFIPGCITDLEDKFIYDIVKKYKPHHVVETGSGRSSLAILVALRENGGGRLHSIDLPYLEGSRSIETNGNIIYDLWKDAQKEFPDWDVREKDICKELPLLLDELLVVDLFFHDSRHTAEQIFFEWNTLISSGKLVKGSLFGTHDRNRPAYRALMCKLKENSKFKSIGYCRFTEFWEVI